MSEHRYLPYIMTYSGVNLYFLDPKPEQILIEDIAHALSMMCRYGGHTQVFSSVAEHCVRVSHLVPTQHALAGLLHDAQEAYLTDMPSPIKQEMHGYRAMETTLWNAIADKFCLDRELPQCVREADGIMLVTEARDRCHQNAKNWYTAYPWRPMERTMGRPTYEAWSQPRAEQEFLARFYQLYSERPAA